MTDLSRAIELLKMGEVIAAPTDTVYGLLADATNDSAIRKVYEIKERPTSLPLIVLVPDIMAAGMIAEIDAQSQKLLQRIWGDEKLPITAVLKAKNISPLITSGGGTVAVRVPNNENTLELLRQLGRPIVAPSANIHGKETPATYAMVKDSIGDRVRLIMPNEGVSKNQLASTIIDFTSSKPVILRNGAVPQSKLDEILEIL